MSNRPAPTARGLGDVIRHRRVALGLSQEALAERASDASDEVRQSDVSRLELGKVGLPRRPRLERLATALGLPIGALLARSGWAGAEDALAAPSPSAPEPGGEPAPDSPPLPAVPPAATSGFPRPSGEVGQNDRLRAAIAQSRVIGGQVEEVLRRSAEVYDRAARPPLGIPSRASHSLRPESGPGTDGHGSR